jgi:hypothetical protein
VFYDSQTVPASKFRLCESNLPVTETLLQSIHT